MYQMLSSLLIWHGRKLVFSKALPVTLPETSVLALTRISGLDFMHLKGKRERYNRWGKKNCAVLEGERAERKKKTNSIL